MGGGDMHVNHMNAISGKLITTNSTYFDMA